MKIRIATAGGRQPMIAAEATASADSALTFSRISLRERMTVERLPSASARLPPVLAWIASTMAKNRTSGVGISACILSSAWSMVMPMPMPSTRRWN